MSQKILEINKDYAGERIQGKPKLKNLKKPGSRPSTSNQPVGTPSKIEPAKTPTTNQPVGTTSKKTPAKPPTPVVNNPDEFDQWLHEQKPLANNKSKNDQSFLERFKKKWRDLKF